MLSHIAPSLLLALAGLSSVHAAVTPDGTANVAKACTAISKAISKKSAMINQKSAQYTEDAYHWSPINMQTPQCTVEPGSVADVSKIIKIIGQQRVPFAVKSGGHTSTKGWSSTDGGVYISMNRFDEVTYNATEKSVNLGTGQPWGKVFPRLEVQNITVAGGRDKNVGVAGLLLGGGYSWITNRHGMAFDNIISYELVKPDGNVITVSKTQYPDLNFALKGGFNNFGIVTSIKVNAYPQGLVYAGVAHYAPEHLDAVWDAVIDNFENNTDVDCQIVFGLDNLSGKNLTAFVHLYHNSPVPVPNGACMGKFNAIPQLYTTLQVRNLTSFIELTTLPNENPQRRTIMHNPIIGAINKPVLKEMYNQVQKWVADPKLKGRDYGNIALIDPWIQNKITAEASASAWPRNTYLSPMAYGPVWTGADLDDYAIAKANEAMMAMQNASAATGARVNTLHPYPNYLLGGLYTNEQIYGENLDQLKKTAKKYDPTKVMTLTGGLKFQ